MATTTYSEYEAGAIVRHSWGFEQTNVDFYRIVRRSGDWVTLRAMTSTETSDGPGTMTGRVVPDEDTDSKPFRRKLRYSNGVAFGVPINAYGWASLWEGRPVAVSHYA